MHRQTIESARSDRTSGHVTRWIVLCLVTSFGCQRSAEIDHYQVPHEPTAQVADDSATPSVPVPSGAAGEAQRMLAAIIPNGAQVWFLKLMGAPDQIEKQADAFQGLLESFRFDDQGGPQWTLPDGWTEQPGNAFRFATLDTGDGMEVTVSSLPAPDGQATTQYFLANVNRWRSQLQLPPQGEDDWATSVRQIEVAGRTAYQVDLTGEATGRRPPMAAGPFQGGTSNLQVEPAAPKPSSTPGPTRAGGLEFTVPDHWRAGQTSSMRLASYTVEDDQGQSAEITVIALGPAPGSLLDNVNRWRGQVELPPVSAAELESDLTTIQVDGTESQYVRIVDSEQGTGEGILAVVVPRSDRTLFIKMWGPNEIVSAESDAFEQFAESIRFAGQE